jgi:hypothetical protein
MGARRPGTTLGRKDNAIGYTPENCRWETQSEQQNNRRSNRALMAFGRVMTLTQWAREYGLRSDTLAYRLDVRRMPAEMALTAQVRGRPAAQKALRPGERIERGIDDQGRVVFMVVAG